MSKLPPYTTRELIAERLPRIFPEGTPHRNYCIRDLATSTIFTMLYIGAIENEDVFMGPVHVYRMTEEQAALTDDRHRGNYRTEVLSRNFNPVGKRWYADNTREPIRDETLREGLIPVGAVMQRKNIATTSGSPRYYLAKEFASLFSPELYEDELRSAIMQWQMDHLSEDALRRIQLAGLSANYHEDKIIITFPNRETRLLPYGPSTYISKAVIEVFAKKFLKDPGLIWLSSSDRKVVFRDNEYAASIGLNIEADKNLPDIILAELTPPGPLLFFIEVVATDGAITQLRQEAIYRLTDAAGFARSKVGFVTAYNDRESPAFKKTIPGLAWNSFAWFVCEPDKIIHMKKDTGFLSHMMIQ